MIKLLCCLILDLSSSSHVEILCKYLPQQRKGRRFQLSKEDNNVTNVAFLWLISNLLASYV